MKTNIIKYLLLLISIVLIVSCNRKESKINYKGSRKIANNLYLEFYEPSGGGAGVFAGSLNSAFLTDSANLNILLGVNEDNETFNFSFSSDSTQFIAKRSKDVIFDVKRGTDNTIYFDTIIVDLKTKKRIK